MNSAYAEALKFLVDFYNICRHHHKAVEREGDYISIEKDDEAQ